MTDPLEPLGVRFQEKTTAFLRDLAKESAAIRKIYLFDSTTEDLPANRDRDILLEKANTPVKGVVYKFAGRVLVLLSYTCAANCRYCERQDRVGVGLDGQGRLLPDEIHRIVDHIARTPEITEVILSGGDPLTHPKGIQLICSLLAKLPQIRIMRIHTRVPVQYPRMVDLELLGEAIKPFPTFYFSVHIDHPDEFTAETEPVILAIRRLGFILLAQTVFLRGVNDDVAVLYRLFTRMAELGIRPYYIYHCQAIPTTMRFVMPLEVEMSIMTQLREQLSGVAYPAHVIDLQHTKGKIIVPTEHWKVDTSVVRDYHGEWLDTGAWVMRPLES